MRTTPATATTSCTPTAWTRAPTRRLVSSLSFQRPLLHPEHGHLSGTALLLPHDGGEAASPHPLPRRRRTAPGGDLLLADGHRPQQDVLHGLLHAPVGQLQHVHARAHLHRLGRVGTLA